MHRSVHSLQDEGRRALRRKLAPVLVLASIVTMVAAAVLAVPALAVSVDQIPSPRPAGWTVDLTRTLSSEEIRALDLIAGEVKAQTGAEMAVVVVGSTDGVPARELATQLFNRWGIGNPQANNGVLLFAALDDRKAELLLGTGIDTEENRRTSEEIMQGQMVPRFRGGDPGGALIHGAEAAARRILGVSPALPEAPRAAPAVPSSPAPAPPAVQPFSSSPARNGYVWVWALAAGLIGTGAWTWYRFVPPRCAECRERMTRLSESGDDLHLEPFEQAEERIGSVDYDVWMCGQCGTFKKIRYLRLFSGYGTCPGCGARTKSKVSITLRNATEYETGLVQITEACALCDCRTTREVVTPMLQNRSSRGSSSHSSSSSGSGFSGGSSSGGGASGSW
jgi:uncharacterized protein